MELDMQRINIPLVIFFSAGVALGFQAHAEIYKWTDKDGTVRYTDTPPPSGAKPLKTIKKNATNSPSVAPAPASSSQPSPQQQASPEELAKKKREIDEIEKKNKAEKEAQAKQKQLNCAAAKANFQSYSQGGRIYKNDENGERVYLGDQELADGAAQAQKEINENCN
jgi:hypothetical protein